jgi:hypothetical protein
MNLVTGWAWPTWRRNYDDVGTVRLFLGGPSARECTGSAAKPGSTAPGEPPRRPRREQAVASPVDVKISQLSLVGPVAAATQVGNGLSYDRELKTGFRTPSEPVTWLDLDEPQFDTWSNGELACGNQADTDQSACGICGLQSTRFRPACGIRDWHAAGAAGPA